MSKIPNVNSLWGVKKLGAGKVRKGMHDYRIMREIEAMEFVRRNTSIPVPTVLEIHRSTDANSPAWFLMSEASGQQLDLALPNMTTEAKARMVSLLKGHLAQLHALCPPTPGFIGSCSGGPCYDHRLTNMGTVGPFDSVRAFNDYLVSPVRKGWKPETVDRFRRELRDDHDVVFAHADLSWESILVDETTGDVTAIIDWEMAGYWPIWWEYRKALYASRSEPPWWRRIVDQIMPVHPQETGVDFDLESFWGI